MIGEIKGVNSNERKTHKFLIQNTFLAPWHPIQWFLITLLRRLTRVKQIGQRVARATTSIGDNRRKRAQRGTTVSSHPACSPSRAGLTLAQRPDSAIAFVGALPVIGNSPVGRSTPPWNTHKSSARAYVIPWHVYIIHGHRWKGRQPYYVCRGLLCSLNV